MPVAPVAPHTPTVSASPSADPAVVVRELLLAAISVLLGLVLLGILIGTNILPDGRSGALRGLTFLYSPLALLVSAAIYAVAGRRLDDAATPPILPPQRRPGLLRALLELLLHTALALLGSSVIGALMAQLGAPVVEQAPILEITGGGLGLRPDLLLLIASAIIAAPLAEELLLRGLLFRRLYVYATPLAAHLSAAVAFAVIHGHLAGFVVYLWLAYCFARVYARTGRLWTAVLVHLGNNAVTLAFLLAGPPG